MSTPKKRIREIEQQEDEPISLEDLTTSQWIDIRKKALESHRKNEFQGDQMKCSIKGFLDFINETDLEVSCSDNQSYTVH